MTGEPDRGQHHRLQAIQANGWSGMALRRLFGIDLDDPAQRDHLATTLADILIVGLLVPPAA